MIKMTAQEFAVISNYIRIHYGLNLEKKQFLIESKLWIELARYKVDNYTDYWQLLIADSSGVMKQKMIDLLTTNYTYFCREEDHFKYIGDTIIPELEKRHIGVLNIWCAACATGQECYTLAMKLLDYQMMGILKVPFTILGTDISEQALTAARKGEYNSADYARLPKYWQSAYCEPYAQGCFKVKQNVRELVHFKNHNLLKTLGMMERFKVVFCRNVLIYFKERERNVLLDTVARSMEPGGYLLVGHTESLLGSTVPLDYIKPSVYRKPEDR